MRFADRLDEEAPGGTGVLLCVFIGWVILGRTGKVFDVLLHSGLHWAYWLYGLWPVPGMIMIVFVLPEHTTYVLS